MLVVLAKALTDALDSGDVSGARAIARALLVLVEELPNDAGGGSRS